MLFRSYTGLRPGEKLYEEPLADAEKTLATPHPKLRIARARSSQNGRLLEEMLRWLENPGEADAEAVRARLRAWVPEYAAPSAELPATHPQTRTARRP